MLEKKIAFAKKVLSAALEKVDKEGKRLEIGYSGGKDSDIILCLAREVAGERCNLLRPIYKDTTIDPPGTRQHVLSVGAERRRPTETFGELIARAGLPNRFFRHCCRTLKEYKIEDNCVIGIRRSESVKRTQRYREPERCRLFSGGSRVHQYYPILEWTDEDVVNFIADRGLQLHPLYYDEEGRIHVERRLGCLCCPLMTVKSRIEQFRENKWMLKFYLFHAKRYLIAHPDSATARRFEGDPYRYLYYNIIAHGDPSAVLPLETDYRQVLSEAFHIDF